MFKSHSALGQPIDVRRLDQRMSVAFQITIQIVANQKKDIRFRMGSNAADKNSDQNQD